MLLYRGYSLQQLWESDFEEMLHLMVWEKYPTSLQKEALRHSLALHMSNIPDCVVKAIESIPYALYHSLLY